MVRHLWRDIGFGLRLLRKRPGFAAAALLCLILGIGLNTAAFTVLDAVFLHALPVQDPESLVRIYLSRANDAGEYTARLSHSHPHYLDLREAARSFDGLAIYQWWLMNLTGGSEPERATGMLASANYFEVLGLRPAAGRFFLPEEDETPGTHPVAVLGNGCWQRLFGGEPEIVGSTVRVNGRTMTVVGVVPRGFHGTDITVDVDFWVPVMMYPELGPMPDYFDFRGSPFFAMFGRLGDGVTIATA